MEIRWMIRRDMRQVLDIENRCFEFPWTEEDFIKQLRQRSCIGVVIENREAKILGYMLYMMHRTRIEIVNIAVDPQHREVRYGSDLVNVLIEKLTPARDRIDVLVRERNTVAQMFFQHHGFQWTKTQSGYYKGTNDDAYTLTFRRDDGVLVLKSIMEGDGRVVQSQFVTKSQSKESKRNES